MDRRLPFALAILLAVVAASLAPAPAAAQRIRDWLYERPIDDGWKYGGDESFIVGTVVAVRDSASTCAHPPLVTVKVDEVLRGKVPRKLVMEWRPIPFWLPCMVGEQGNLRRWRESRYPGPAVGSRYVLSLVGEPSGLWWTDPSLRWDATTDAGKQAREKVLEWNPKVEARLLREKPERDRKAKLAAEQAEKDRMAREKAAEERLAHEHAWFRSARTLRKTSDLEELVRTSDAVFLCPPPVGPANAVAGWGKSVRLRPSAWILRPARADVVDSSVAVAFGQREDSLLARWTDSPGDDRAGPDLGRPLVALAFLRAAGEPGAKAEPYLRPADPQSGILWADEATVRRARELVAARPSLVREPPRACGASLAEFAVRDTLEATEIGIKLSPLDRRSPNLMASVVIVSGREKSTEGMTTLDAGSFTPCALPDERHMQGHRANHSARVSAEQMKAFLDSLLLVPELAEGRIDPADSVTLALRRIVDGRERIYETTLDGYALQRVCRIMIAVFPRGRHGDGYFPGWWSALDRRFHAIWYPPAPRTPLPLVFAEPPPAADSTRGSLVGWIVDAKTDEPVVGAEVRTFNPPAATHTDDEGAFALRDRMPGRRWVQISAPYYEMSIAPIDYVRGVIDTVIIVIQPDGKRPAPVPRDSSLDRNVAWHPAPAKAPKHPAALLVEVKDDRGAPIPRAYVVVNRKDTMYGALTDPRGRLTFPAIEPGRFDLLVRSADTAPFRRTLQFVPDARDTLRLSLAPRRR